MKKNKIYIIVIIIVIIGLVGGFITLRSYKSPTQIINNENECFTKGNVCSDDEIINGIKYVYEVKNNKTYEFYVIANDENTLTLLMNDNLADNIDWQSEGINMKGPTGAFLEVIDICQNWKNVPEITNYEYPDYGKLYSENVCQNQTLDNYDCDYEENRGYKGIWINNDNSIIEYNLLSKDGEEVLQSFDLSDFTVRARLITFEEVRNLSGAKWLIENLEAHEGYWTLSSSTTKDVGYSNGAYAVVDYNNFPTLISAYAKNEHNDDYKMGIRPVITIDKR